MVLNSGEMMNHLTQASNILAVEDSAEDYHATVRAFKKTGLNNPIYHCEDGDEALDYLYKRGNYSDPDSAPIPELILLDLNLPGTDGKEILEDIKQNPELKKIPVIVLTTSSHEKDIDDCYRLGANTYIQKPVSINGFYDAITKIKDYWFEIALTPQPKGMS